MQIPLEVVDGITPRPLGFGEAFKAVSLMTGKRVLFAFAAVLLSNLSACFGEASSM